MTILGALEALYVVSSTSFTFFNICVFTCVILFLQYLDKLVGYLVLKWVVVFELSVFWEMNYLYRFIQIILNVICYIELATKLRIHLFNNIHANVVKGCPVI